MLKPTCFLLNDFIFLADTSFLLQLHLRQKVHRDEAGGSHPTGTVFLWSCSSFGPAAWAPGGLGEAVIAVVMC